MKLSKAIDMISLCYEADMPFILWGPPGVGKSEGVRQAAEKLGIGLQDERMAQRDLIDVRGLLVPIDGKPTWLKPDFFPEKGKGLLFLDELSAAPSLIQVACYQLINERRIGNFPLKKGWLPCAAGNREIDRAAATRMSSALANRLVHIEIDVDVDDWIGWAMNAGIRPEIMAFIRWRPEFLHSFDPAKNERAFPTPRSNEKLSILMDAAKGDLDYELAMGVVGERYATEFYGFLKIYQNLPDIDVILARPKDAPVPDDISATYAVCGALANVAVKANFGKVMAYANRLPVEFSTLLVRDAISRDASLAETKAFIEWSSKNAEALI